MMDFIMIPIVMGIITLGVYKLFALFVRRHERMAIIEKLDPSQLPRLEDERIQMPVITSSALSVGCLLVGLGLGLLVGFLICAMAGYNTDFSRESYDVWNLRQTMGTIYAGSLLFFGGVGLIASVVISRLMARKE